MIGERVIERKPVSLVDVKQLLSDRKKVKELSYEQDIAFNYAKKFAKLSSVQAEKLSEELSAIGGLTPEVIVKIIDILPEKKEILQLLIPKEVVLDEASLQKIFDLCKKHKK